MGSSTCYEIQDLFGKGNDDTSRDGQKSVCPLGRVVRFKRKAHLHDAEPEKNQPDSADQSENEVGQIVNNGQRVSPRFAVCEHRNRHHTHKGERDNDCEDRGESPFTFSLCEAERAV